MENASKALIIAGAILISILIISLGILIYNQASGVLNNSAMSEADISTFNSKFTQYEGSKVTGSTVNAMLQAVLSNNLTQDDDTRKVSVTGAVTLDKGANSIASGSKAATSATYKVEITTYSGQGLVSVITVTKN